MPEEKNLSLVNTVEDTDKIRVVTSVEGLSQSIEVGHLRNSLFINELSNEVSTLEIRANANDTAHDTIDSRLTSLESAVGEEGDGETELGFGLVKKVNDIASDLAKIDPEDITRLGNNISQIQADLTSINGTNGQLAILTDKQDILEESIANLASPKLEVLENYREKLVTLSGTSTTIDLSLANVFTHTLDGNTTYSITNAVSNQAHSFTLIINQAATARTLTFPASVKWQDGEIPDLTTASKTYVLTFMTVDGGTTWLGMFGGEF